jgi:hypothetical protein
VRDAIGYGSYALGRSREILSRIEAAAEAFAESAEAYRAADNLDHAEDAAEQAERLRFALTADVDGASIADLPA